MVLTLDPELSHASVDDLKAFPLDDRDVVVAGYPKSGTNWFQIMVANLWDDWTTLRNDRGQVPNLSGKDRPGYAGYEACLAVPGPRLMKTHLPVELMPRRWPEHGRVVHITRNPKDVCVSYFHDLRGLARSAPHSRYALPDGTTMRQFARTFERGEVPYGRYTENVIGWRRLTHPHLLHVEYEQAKVDIRGTLERVIAFVGKPISEGRLDSVIAQTEFQAMRSGDIRQQINHPDLREGADNAFLRKGIVGDWKEEMSTADSEFLDATIVSELEAADVRLVYAPST